MNTVLMVVDPRKYKSKITDPLPNLTTHRISLTEFSQREKLLRRHDEVLSQAFHTHGKYLHTVAKVDYVVVAVDEHENYIGSAMIVKIGDDWRVEYLMRVPEEKYKGVGTMIMDHIMRDAPDCGILRIQLQCDPKNLSPYYAEIGFKEMKP